MESCPVAFRPRRKIQTLHVDPLSALLVPSWDILHLRHYIPAALAFFTVL